MAFLTTFSLIFLSDVDPCYSCQPCLSSSRIYFSKIYWWWYTNVIRINFLILSWSLPSNSGGLNVTGVSTMGDCLKTVTLNKEPRAKLLLYNERVIPLFVPNRTHLHKHCLLTKAQDEWVFQTWIINSWCGYFMLNIFGFVSFHKRAIVNYKYLFFLLSRAEDSKIVFLLKETDVTLLWFKTTLWN